MKGLFVVFEGITGSGKKTHIKLLAEKLKERGKEVTVISFPNYETEIARFTKRPDLDSFTQSLLFAADRSLHQERIKALLEKGNVVLCDRYCYSNFAYQAAKGLPIEWLKEIEKHNIKPDIVFLIDVPVEVSMNRVKQLSIEDFTKKEILERLEKEKEFLEKIREIYLSLAVSDKETKWFVVNGSEEISVNHEKIWEKVKEELKIL
ncbi:MAG: dTMP kinase [Candidatus Aenigmarchaeota archaeon]|nr:dTMP kinase [Candidatus Aenigmarchaeota archaeon]